MAESGDAAGSGVRRRRTRWSRRRGWGEPAEQPSEQYNPSGVVCGVQLFRPWLYGGVAGDVTYFLVEHLLLQRGRMASAALSDF